MACSMDFEFIKTAFITMFVAIDPPGLIAIFLSLTAHMSIADRKITAFHSVTVALVVLIAAALGGEAVMRLLGISVPAFRIAGGLLLFYIAFEMVFEKRVERKTNTADEAIHDHPKNIAVFPLAIPMMAGPGAITATIIQAGAAGGSVINTVGFLFVLAAVIGSCLVCFLLANRLDRYLGNTGRVVLSRLLGLLLAALAIQIIGDGILAFAH